MQIPVNVEMIRQLRSPLLTALSPAIEMLRSDINILVHLKQYANGGKAVEELLSNRIEALDFFEEHIRKLWTVLTTSVEHEFDRQVKLAVRYQNNPDLILEEDKEGFLAIVDDTIRNAPKNEQEALEETNQDFMKILEEIEGLRSDIAKKLK